VYLYSIYLKAKKCLLGNTECVLRRPEWFYSSPILIQNCFFKKIADRVYYIIRRYGHLPFFLTENCVWAIEDSGKGSSVTNKTRSLLTLVNNKMSENNSAQYDLTDRPSTRLRSPANIQWRSGVFNVKGCQTSKRLLWRTRCHAIRPRSGPLFATF